MDWLFVAIPYRDDPRKRGTAGSRLPRIARSRGTLTYVSSSAFMNQSYPSRYLHDTQHTVMHPRKKKEYD
jgi:hypothetical protein